MQKKPITPLDLKPKSRIKNLAFKTQKKHEINYGELRVAGSKHERRLTKLEKELNNLRS